MVCLLEGESATENQDDVIDFLGRYSYILQV
jgi:hypothetical protein